MDTGNLYDLCDSQWNRLVGGTLHFVEIDGELRKEVPEQHAVPAVLRTELCKVLAYKAGIGIGEITAIRTAAQALCELIGIDIRRNHPALQVHHGCAQ